MHYTEAYLLLAEAGVDDEHDAVDREGGLGDVRANDDLPARRTSRGARAGSLSEDVLLLPRGKRRVQRVHHQRAAPTPEGVGLGADTTTDVLNLLLAGEEEQHVAWSLVLVDLEGRSYRGLDVVLLGLRRVEDLHRVGPAGNFHQRGVVEVCLELGGIESSRHDDELEVASLLQELFE